MTTSSNDTNAITGDDTNTGSDDNNAGRGYYQVGIASAAVMMVTGFTISAVNGDPDPIVLTSGVSAFALLYAATQGIERIVELSIEVISMISRRKHTKKKDPEKEPAKEPAKESKFAEVEKSDSLVLQP